MTISLAERTNGGSHVFSDVWPSSAHYDAAGNFTIAGQVVAQLAEKHGTPLYIFDEQTIRLQARAYLEALATNYPGGGAVHYAGKAYLNIAIAQLLAQEGLGLDVVSGGELSLALRAGVAPQKIHMHGNAKTPSEMSEAIQAGVSAVVIDNLEEIALLESLLGRLDKSLRVLLRVNPATAVDTHPHIRTSHQGSKFGLCLASVDEAARQIRCASRLQFDGLHFHLGSQIRDLGFYREPVGLILDIAAELRKRHGLVAKTISPGGGLGIRYRDDDTAPDIEHFVRDLSNAFADGCKTRHLELPRLVFEPGRSIIGRAGVAVYRVVATKDLPTKGREEPIHVVSVDGGMGDNIRPALYGARCAIALGRHDGSREFKIGDLAGRYCESGDLLVRQSKIPRCTPGELLIVAAAGAYTLSMASNYNMTPRPAVVLASDRGAALMQRRETYADLWVRDFPLTTEARGT